MAQVRLESDTEELVREWAEEHDCSLSAAVNAMLRELGELWADGPEHYDLGTLVSPARASVARGTRQLRRGRYGLG